MCKRMSRKPERSIWRNGDRRRSSRISGKVDDTEERGGDDENKGDGHEKEGGHHKRGGSSSKSRTRTKRKLNQDEMESSQDGDKQKDEDELNNCGKFLKLPEKRILEHILDTLQRRDVHEIFAEPVDPSEVEDYYEIIEHPMDFGTMRAKLHEGMYQNLEQFEHDIFLIPRNAMHFNSSSSIYFRQARGIYELAEKLFHVLKTDPEHFALKFPREKRRTITRAMGKSKSVESSMRSTNQGSKYSNSCQLDSKKRQARRGVDVDASCSNRKSGRETRKLQSFEVDPRDNYYFWRPSSNNRISSVGARMYTDPKQINLINQPDIDYNKSLMMFVKDLGPTAQNIAKKKLQQWPQIPLNKPSVSGMIERRSVFPTTTFGIPSWKNPVTLLGSSSQTIINQKCRPFCDPVGAKEQEGASSNKKILKGGGVKTDSNAVEKEKLNTKCSDMKVGDLTLSKKDNVCIKNRRTAIETEEIERCSAGELNFISVEKRKLSAGNKSKEGKEDARMSVDRILPVVLALEHPRPDPVCDQLKPRDKKNSTDQTSTIWHSNQKEKPSFYNSEAKAIKAPNVGLNKNRPAEQSTLAPSSFSFAAPFLNQAHLTSNQINGHVQAGLGLNGFSRFRFQGAVDNNRVYQEGASSSKSSLHDGFHNQLPWHPRNPPETNFVPRFHSPWREFVLNDSIL